MSINYSDYSLEAKTYLYELSNNIKQLTGSQDDMSVEEMTAALQEFSGSYCYKGLVPEPRSVSIFNFNDSVLISKTELTQLANATRSLCEQDFSTSLLEVSQMASIIGGLEVAVQPKTVHVCREIPPYSDCQQELSRFTIEGVGEIDLSGGKVGSIQISNVSSEEKWITSTSIYYNEQCWLIVEFDVTFLNPDKINGETKLWIKTASMGSDAMSELVTFTTDCELAENSQNDDGKIDEPTEYHSSSIYINDYLGPLPNDITIQIQNTHTYTSVGTITIQESDLDENSSVGISLSNSYGESFIGTCKYICTGYYSENDEARYEYYITGTLSSVRQSDYQITVTVADVNRSHQVTPGTDMEYIEEPTDQGDLSSQYTFEGVFYIEESDSWAAEGFNVTVIDSYSNYSTCSERIMSAGTYWAGDYKFVIDTYYKSPDTSGYYRLTVAGWVYSKDVKQIVAHQGVDVDSGPSKNFSFNV